MLLLRCDYYTNKIYNIVMIGIDFVPYLFKVRMAAAAHGRIMGTTVDAEDIKKDILEIKNF